MTSKTKVLIVDDHIENIVALKELINQTDIEIFEAETPMKALELLSENDFGLALLDVQMPEMSGFELARLIRGVNRHRHLPIIFVTAHQRDQNFVFEGYDSGAVDILFKPLDLHIVRTKVRAFVELSQQKILLEEQLVEMQKLRKAAEAANQAKTQFLANMSHEIRTPLAAVMGFADLIASDSVSKAEQPKYADMIRRNGDLLLRLIDDILDLSKIESDTIEFEEATFDLCELLSDVQETITQQTRAKGIKIEFDKPEQGSHFYHADPLRIKQILINLLGNAIKFTQKGSVSLRFHSQSSRVNPSKEVLRFTVADTGVGMTKEQARNIFKPFSQGDSSMRRQFGGSGLGLTISKRLAQAYDGDIILVDSRPNGGSTFEITLELTKAAPQVSSREEQAAEIEELSKLERELRVLAIDDAPDNLVLLRLYLKDSNIELTEAHSAKEGIKLAKKNTFDLILMDIQMPEMDGREATGILRDLGYDKPIIALTAHAVRSEQEKCLEAGCDAVLTKPISKDDLLQKITSIAGGTHKAKADRLKRNENSSSVTPTIN